VAYETTLFLPTETESLGTRLATGTLELVEWYITWKYDMRAWDRNKCPLQGDVLNRERCPLLGELFAAVT
jgi:hypothetical protein